MKSAMKMLSALCLLLGLATLNPALAADAVPSETSVRELMKVMHAERTVEGMMGNIKSMLERQVAQSMESGKLNTKQQKVLTDMKDKMLAAFAEEMSWKKMEPVMVGIYQKSLSQEDVDAITTFYKTKAGQNLLEKQPQVMQASVEFSRERMAALQPRIEKIQQEAMEKMKAIEGDKKK